MSERPRFYPNAKSLEDRAQKLERVKGLVQTIYQNLGGDQGPAGLNIINPQLLPEGPMERVAEMISRGIRVARVRQYVETEKLPNITSQFDETRTEIQRIKDLIQEGIPILKGLSAFLRPEEIATIEAQLSLVTPDVTFLRPEAPTPGKEKKGIQPIAESKMQAIENIVSNSEEMTLEDVTRLFEQGLKEEGKTPKKSLAWNMILFGLNRSVMMLSRRVKNQSATDKERVLWSNIKTTLNLENDQYVIKTFAESAKGWFNRKRGMTVQEPPAPKEDTTQEAEDYSEIKNHPDMVNFLNRLPQPTRDLIVKFLDSKQGNWIITQIKKFHPGDPAENGIESRDFRLALSGALFAQLSYHHISSLYANRQDLFVLSSEEVYILYKNIYPERGIINFGGYNLDFGISGISYPDGLVLRDTPEALILDAVLEYKMWVNSIPNQRQFEAQLEQYKYNPMIRTFFRRENIDQQFHSLILKQMREAIPVKPIGINAEFDIIYGLPENSAITIPEYLTPEYVPVNSAIFGNFVDLLIRTANEKREITAAVDAVGLSVETQIPEGVRFPDGQGTQGMSETELKILEGLLIALENPLEETELARFVFPDQDEKTAISKLRFAMPSFKAKSITRNWTVETTPQTAEDKRTLLSLTKIPGEENNGSRAKLA